MTHFASELRRGENASRIGVMERTRVDSRLKSRHPVVRTGSLGEHCQHLSDSFG
jgi:hypothetical protein